MWSRSILVAFTGMLAACGSDPVPVIDAPAQELDAAGDDKAASCASTFGTALTDAFGRIDGTVLAVVPPAHPTCAQPNSSHVVVQLTMDGAAYRMVVNVDSTRGTDRRVYSHTVEAALAGDPWSEGWHPGTALDYVATLATTSTAFVPHEEAETVALVTDALELGAKVSVFATSTGGTKADSAHLVHRNAANADGAIVIDPDGAPRYLLFRFADQTF